MLIINDGLNDFDLLEKQWVDLLSDPLKMIINYSSYDYFIDMLLYDRSYTPPCFSIMQALVISFPFLSIAPT